MNVGAHGGVTASAAGLVEMIDTFDRKGKAFAKGRYAGTDKTAVAFKNKPGERLPKAELSAAAGVGHARAEWSVFDADAKGPNACAGVGASVASLGAEAFAKAELASASASAGPVKVKVGLAADTGVGVGLTGVEAKVLGTGISFGRKMGISLFGSEFSFNLW
uniref:Si:ch73-106k19.5 n=1 Tax=Amphiprion percula TaxID=161767 RepID=A0A3P8U221_AMPPE